jgi:hypothetical protein
MAHRKKIKQGQSRWANWVSSECARNPDGTIKTKPNSDVVVMINHKVHVQRYEVMYVRGDMVTVKAAIHEPLDPSNTTMQREISSAEWFAHPATVRQAKRQADQWLKTRIEEAN